jgi:hypothetical protein
MIKIKLGNRRYKLPERFTIEQWHQVVRMDLEDPNNWPKIMSIAFNLPYWKFHNIDEDSLLLGVSLVINRMAQRRECEIKDFTQLRLGEFIDLDIYMIMGIEKNIEEILKLITPKKIKWADEALWLIDQYANYRISIYRQYSLLFESDGIADDEIPENWNPKEVAEGWYRVLVDLADDDILKLDAVVEQPLMKSLNFLTLRKRRAIDEALKQKQQQKQYDLQRNRR